MKVVIDINNEIYKEILSGKDGWSNYVHGVIRNGTPLPKWIPVSERLPNFNDIVLASADSDYDELRVILTVYGAEEFWFNGKIKAWMPLPEPYRAESEEE